MSILVHEVVIVDPRQDARRRLRRFRDQRRHILCHRGIEFRLLRRR